MYKLIYSLIAIFLLSCKSTTFFIVRHAEKEAATTMTSDVPLSEAGKQRAIALKDLLQNEKIRHIYSTNYIRTKATAQPLAETLGLTIQTYDPRDTSFMSKVRNVSNSNVLIVGHSNTVDDLVNKMTGETHVPGDLPDSQYGDLYVIKKKGGKYMFERRHFGL